MGLLITDTKIYAGLQVSLDVALLIQSVLITQEVELGFFGRETF